MNKIIAGAVALLIAGICIAGTLDYTTEQVNHAVRDNVESIGAGGYSTVTNLSVLTGQWTDVPASFVIPYASGFEYVSGSTVRYVGEADHTFLFGGSCSLTSGTINKLIEVGLEINGVYLTGSSSGQRKFSSISDSGSMSYAIPVALSSNDTVGLVIKCPDGDIDITINTWQSWAIRF
jgi:hypothetical protein